MAAANSCTVGVEVCLSNGIISIDDDGAKDSRVILTSSGASVR